MKYPRRVQNEIVSEASSRRKCDDPPDMACDAEGQATSTGIDTRYRSLVASLTRARRDHIPHPLGGCYSPSLHVDQHLIAIATRDLSSEFSATYRRFIVGKSARLSREICPAHARIVLCWFLPDSRSADAAVITSIVRIILAVVSQATFCRAMTY
jgi:hypothetical protein